MQHNKCVKIMYFNSKAKEQRWLFWQVSQKREDISICLSFVHLFSKMIFLCVFLSETLRPCPHYTVFKRKRHCFVPDTANVHNTTPKTISENGSIRKRSPECTAKTMLSENDDVTTNELTTSTVSIQDSGQTLPRVASLLIAVIFSLLTLLKAHLTLLRLFDFSRREQNIVKLLSLPALGGTRTIKTTET